jgi:hypothetical protein
MDLGLPVVLEGRRIRLRVFRRFFYPIRRTLDGEEFIVYSDTGREREINYKNAEEYGLDNPWNLIALVRLARAMDCLKCGPEENRARECRVTICNARELNNSTTETRWVPFDPERLEPLAERLKNVENRAIWEKRKSKSVGP